MKTLKIFFAAVALVSLAFSAVAETALKPFVLSSVESGNMADVVAATKAKLAGNGFEVVGSYSPYNTVTVIAVTNDALKAAAAETKFGAFGAAQRVTLSQAKDGIQVAFTNPVYYGNAYRIKSDLSGVKAQLAKALGSKQDYGSEKGKTASDLKEYQYKWLMPYFHDRL